MNLFKLLTSNERILYNDSIHYSNNIDITKPIKTITMEELYYLAFLFSGIDGEKIKILDSDINLINFATDIILIRAEERNVDVLD